MVQTRYFFIIIILILILSQHNGTKLKFVFQIFRHGARAPMWELNSTNFDVFGSKWDGPAILTTIGIKEHYEKGIKDRMKYKNFIKRHFDSNEMC